MNFLSVLILPGLGNTNLFSNYICGEHVFCDPRIEGMPENASSIESPTWSCNSSLPKIERNYFFIQASIEKFLSVQWYSFELFLFLFPSIRIRKVRQVQNVPFFQILLDLWTHVSQKLQLWTPEQSSNGILFTCEEGLFEKYLFQFWLISIHSGLFWLISIQFKNYQTC